MEKIVNFFNPLNEDFFVYQIINGIGEFFFGDGTEENRGLFGLIGDILSFLGNFFGNLLDFFVHIFVPDDNQWSILQEKYSSLGDLAISHLPFVATFYDVLDNQDLAVSNSDMLVITMPSFSFFGGETGEKQVINVREAYEPYRQNIRTGLAYIVYGLGIVYIIKYVIGWGQTQANTEVKENSQYMSWSRKK